MIAILLLLLFPARINMYCAGNALTLIAENTIQPFRFDVGKVKTNEYHLYQLPWPVEVLQQEVGAADVTLKLTLSYFIDPNPGNRRYATNFSYFSHALDFKMIGPLEELPAFRRRISAADADEGVGYVGQEEPWLLKETMRSRGSVKKDLLICSGADLATRGTLAVYPKSSGWYRSRKQLGLAETVVRYSLIVSIETDNVQIDVYNPVVQLIENSIGV